MATATSPSPDDGTNNKRPKKDREPPQRPMHHPHHYSYGPPPPPHVYYGPPGYPPHLPMAPPAGMGAPPGMPPYGRERKVDYYHPYPGMPYGGGGPTSPRRHRPIEMYPREMEVGGGIIRGMDDDGTSSAGGSTKDKSRGNYKCGRVSRTCATKRNNPLSNTHTHTFITYIYIICIYFIYMYMYIYNMYVYSAGKIKKVTCVRINPNHRVIPKILHPKPRMPLCKSKWMRYVEQRLL